MGKQLTMSGYVTNCEPRACNPSGDVFSVNVTESVITVTREDGDGCWSDGRIYIRCCITSLDVVDAIKLLAMAGDQTIPNSCQGPLQVAAAQRTVEGARAVAINVKAEVDAAAARRPHCKVVKSRKDCPACCFDGKGIVPCLDVDTCANQAPTRRHGKFAFFLAQLGIPRWPWLTFLGEMRSQADAMMASTNASSVDIVILMLPSDARKLQLVHLKHLETHRAKVVEVQWSLPPTLKWYPSNWWPGKADGWCGPQDLVRLHVLGFDEYDAVAFFDQDVQLQGDLGPVFQCASTGYFISASGGAGEPLNVGFFAVRPDRRLLLAAERFADNMTFSVKTGWGGIGFAPCDNKFVGAECGQGYFHTLFYKQYHQRVKEAFAAAGLPLTGATSAPRSAQVDRCVWNYQGGVGCAPRFDCRRVRAHHKPTSKPVGRDCGKLKYNQASMPKEAALSPARRALPPWALLACRPQLVQVGPQRDCQMGPIKHLTLEGYASHCESTACNPSGDVFSVNFTSSAVTISREDGDGCWNDGRINVRCCIVAPDVVSAVETLIAVGETALSPP